LYTSFNSKQTQEVHLAIAQLEYLIQKGISNTTKTKLKAKQAQRCDKTRKKGA